MMMFKKLLFIATSDAEAVRAAVNGWIWAKPGRTNVSRKRLTCVPPDWILRRGQALVWDGREKWREIVEACKARGIEVIDVAAGGGEKRKVSGVERQAEKAGKSKKNKEF